MSDPLDRPCAICGARATVWSSHLVVFDNLITGEEDALLLNRGAWCAAHARPGRVDRIPTAPLGY